MKYFKPRSVTWWGGVLPVVAGLIVATAEIHGNLAAVTAINNITGGIPAAALINSGLVAIGLRGAIS
tara:strand:- start:34137 stop:34337 length:201 start_codon:yes stop_codon:yes gene_type:complete